MLKKLSIILILLAFAFSLKAQKVTLVDRIKAEHIYNFGIYVNWKKNNTLNKIQTDRFYIGVCSKDTLMFDLMRRICKWRILKWKKIEVLYFPNVSSISYVQILYVAQNMNNSVPDIDKAISGWPTLLVTDSCQNYNNVMINFFPKNALKKVEINKEAIEKRGMKVSPLLFTVAKKYEEDWESMFRKSEDNLQAEKEIVDQQQKVLEDKSREIKEKETQINTLSETIDEKEKHLEQQKRLLLESQAELSAKIQLIAQKSKILNSQQFVIKGQESEIIVKKNELENQVKEFGRQKKVLDEQETEIQSQKNQIDSQKSELNKTLENLKKQQLVMYFLGVVVIFIGLLAFSIYRGYRIKKKINAALKRKNIEIFQQKEEIEAQRDKLVNLNEELVEKNEEISAQHNEIEAQRDEIAAQRDTVVNQKKQIEYILSELTDSIQYAGRIQNAILPSESKWANFPFEHFILYKPRDIVSGDFYWFENIKDYIVFCVADCTGHGVPGAIMSMLGVAALHDAVKVESEFNPAKILVRTRDYIINALQQESNNNNAQYVPSIKDGMDIALCVINTKTLELQFAGANNPVYIISLGEDENLLTEIKGDKMPIGIHERMDVFTLHTHQLQKGDGIYLFSDGIADQFGGELGKKFKYKQLKNLLTTHINLPLGKQQELIEKAFTEWKDNLEQVDDVCIFGVRV